MAYPMLNTERARIVNEAVSMACHLTGYEAPLYSDMQRWWVLADIYIERAKRARLHMERWP